MGDAHYRYDPSGELLEHWDPTDGSDTTYGYDGAGYTYDHNGNRLTKGLTNGGGSYSDAYAYQPDYYASNLHTDELVSVQGGVTGNRVFTYDANGDLRSANANGYLLFLTPDYEDRYARFDFDTGPGQGRAYATETYNGLGARFARRSADGHQHGMALDGVAPGAALLYDSDGGMLFTPGVGQTSGGAGGTSLYTNVDALGSVHDTQTDGDYPRDQMRFEAFGGAVLRNCSDPLPLGFAGAAGYQTDADTGLMLLGSRYYDASVGRFITPDPAGAGDNWYAYCGNDPLTNTDPTGLRYWPMNGGSGDDNAAATSQAEANDQRADEFMAPMDAFCRFAVNLAASDKNGYASQDAAARGIADAAIKAEIKGSLEVGGFIYLKGGKYYVNGPFTGNVGGIDLQPQYNTDSDKGQIDLSYYHTHPSEYQYPQADDPGRFSNGDITFADNNALNAYLFPPPGFPGQKYNYNYGDNPKPKGPVDGPYTGPGVTPFPL